MLLLTHFYFKLRNYYSKFVFLISMIILNNVGKCIHFPSSLLGRYTKNI